VVQKLLIANRGEIAIRLAHAAAEAGITTVAVFAEDDAQSLHTRRADESYALRGVGPAAYLDAAQIVEAAKATGCYAVHPGYGFLSENAAFGRLCEAEGLTFVGPAPETLEQFGDKAQARSLAKACGVAVPEGTDQPTSLQGAQAFREALGTGASIMLKALAGGGGRGMRLVGPGEDLPAAYERCRSEALAAFGNGDLYVERFFPRGRHVEVQLVGDGREVVHVWDRECSLQRQRQKLIEIAPAVGVSEATRSRLLEQAVALGRAAALRSLCTVEFLVDPDTEESAFIEANPRLQVEHTVTEAVTGLDLVRLQLEIAGGATLADLGLAGGPPETRGVAVQARVNLETMAVDGTARPGGGMLSAYEPPTGPGVRVDGFGYAGYATSARYDSLLAKVIVRAGDLPGAVAKADRALRSFRIEGAPTNIGFLQALLRRPETGAGLTHTRFVEEQLPDLLAAAGEGPAKLFFEASTAAGPKRAGAKVDSVDPLAVLEHGRRSEPASAALADASALDGTRALSAPLQGTVVSIGVEEGAAVRAGAPVLIMEAMKMEHVIAAEVGGVLRRLAVQPGDTVYEGEALAFFEEAEVEGGSDSGEEAVDLDAIRPDLAEVLDRKDRLLDHRRPEATARRRKTGQRTARENIDDLCDPGSFTEFGGLVVAGRRRRNTVEELIDQTPADGLVMGFGQVNGEHFEETTSRAAVLSYDYTVLAGTQGARNHEKLDRMTELAHRWRLPVVFFCEGGGGRPGDTERGGYIRGFEFMGRLSGNAPSIGIASGRCFAGNAAVLGCCDLVIATEDSTIGMGGPAMIEGGGLGVYRPEEVGPVEVQQKSGVIDVLVRDEAAAVAATKQYLGYFQGPLKDWTCVDQRLLRRAVPENRLRVYDIRQVIRTLADEGSVLELRPKFGVGMVTALIRIEGRPLGLIANNPAHLGGAIDSDASDKAARFMQLCEAYDVPILSLSDTPGNMVGPEYEKTGLVRHCSRMFVIGANLTVPLLSVILRKSYGLGAIAMTGGSYQASMFSVSWPTGEYGGMGLEGSVKLGYRNELAAIADPVARKAKFDQMVAAAYEAGKALNYAMTGHIDDVIDPAETRRWVVAALKAAPPPPARTGKKLPWIDAW
jgi:acetyl/propionyl-CoA carboxylase alpha subunit/acetyl-CoA carboxylase carboxyltransferase component